MSLEALRGRWRGRTAVVIASGPSLTAEDCEIVHAAGVPTIVTNTSFRLALWADILFAMDAGWWDTYWDEVVRDFPGERWGYVRRPGIIATKGALYPVGWGNSGTYSISLAVVAKPARILLLGCDASEGPNGEKHWHADHPAKLGNARNMKSWPHRFDLVAKYATAHGIPVVNCSRSTALVCFPRGDLEAELQNEVALA